MRMLADEDMAGAVQILGRTEFACWSHYRTMGYSMTSKGSGRMSVAQKIEFAKQIRSTMLAHDISQRFLSAEYGCHPVYMCGILSLKGRKSLTVDTADKLRQALERCVHKAIMTGASRRRTKLQMAAE